MMVSTVRRSTATRLHVMTATVEEDREELRGTEGPGDTNERLRWSTVTRVLLTVVL